MIGLKLERDSFMQQMWRYGFIAEEIPACFSSVRFAENYDTLNTLVQKTYSTSPVMLSTYKSETERRNVSVPNPYAFANTVKYLGEHYSELRNFAHSKNSDSPITFIHSYVDREIEVINSGIARNALHAFSDFRASLRRRISQAMGYRYRLSVDIATFYDTIYTHSLSWSICGKDTAKRMFDGVDRKSSKYLFADQFDKRVRNQKGQETSGILTGPYTSRIFSELLLAGIDRDLRGKNFIFRRYVDDFKFYFRTESDAQRAIIDIARVLDRYNLAVNQSKTEIVEYPFDIESPLKKLLKNAKEEAGVFGALNEANRLYSAGEKGAYKYALKMLRGENISEQDKEGVLSILLNINLVNPRLAMLIVDYFERHKDAIGEDRLSDIINNELELSLREGYEQEVLNLLFFLRRLHLRIRGDLLLEALKKGNDFISIIGLDFWINERELVAREPKQARLLNEEIRRLEEGLHNQSMDGEHWILLYEARMHNLLNVDITQGKTASFFMEMEKLGISFYGQ